MSVYEKSLTAPVATERTAWGAIIALALGAASFVTSELLPASLLTPIAEGLGVSEGMAGQAISAAAFVAIFASLFATTLTRHVDRQLVAMTCTGLVAVGALVVALAPNYFVMLTGRVLFGLGLGAFWAMSPSLILRLARTEDVPKALSLLFGAIPVAMMVSVPMASFLGAHVGWRGVFFVASALAVLCLLLQALTVPALPARRRGNVLAVFALRKQAGIPLAMLALFCVFAGKFSFFAYIRPFLEIRGGFDVVAISTMLLVFGASNLVGTSASSLMIRRDLKTTLAVPPLVVAFCAAGLLLASATPWSYGAFFALWGFSIGFIPVAWTTWVTRVLGHDAENAGCMQFAVMQSAIATGVICGGVVIDTLGTGAPLALGACLLGTGFILIVAGIRRGP